MTASGPAGLFGTVTDSVVAAALIIAFWLFLKGLKDQRAEFKVMLEEQRKALRDYTARDRESHQKLAQVIETNTRALTRAEIRLDTQPAMRLVDSDQPRGDDEK